MGLLDYALVATRRTNTMRGETWCGAKAGMTTAYPAPYPSWYDEHWVTHGHGHVNWTIAFSGTAAQPDTLIPHGYDPSPSVPAEDPFGWQPGQTGYNGTVHLPVDDTFARLGFDIQGGYVHERGATGTRVLGGAMSFLAGTPDDGDWPWAAPGDRPTGPVTVRFAHGGFYTREARLAAGGDWFAPWQRSTRQEVTHWYDNGGPWPWDGLYRARPDGWDPAATYLSEGAETIIDAIHVPPGNASAPLILEVLGSDGNAAATYGIDWLARADVRDGPFQATYEDDGGQGRYCLQYWGPCAGLRISAPGGSFSFGMRTISQLRPQASHAELAWRNPAPVTTARASMTGHQYAACIADSWAIGVDGRGIVDPDPTDPTDWQGSTPTHYQLVRLDPNPSGRLVAAPAPAPVVPPSRDVYVRNPGYVP